MALKNKAITVTYVAWDASANAGKTGDAANHTLKLIQDGTEASPTNSPSEVDATNAPGIYKLALTAGDMNFNAVTLCGKSSTANVSIIPLVIVTEQGNLDATVSSRSTYAGADTSGTTTLLSRLTSTRAGNLDNLDAAVSTRSTYAGGDTSGTTTLLARLTATRAGLLDNLDAAISTRSTYAGGAVASVTAPVTVGTNSDKTGYSLTQSFPANFADLAITATTGKVTVGTVGDKTGYSLAQSFPSNFASLAITAGGAVTAGTVSDKTGYGLASDGLDSITIESGLNARQSLSIIASACAGAGGTTSNLYKGAGVATTRITFTASGGERSIVTLSPPA